MNCLRGVPQGSKLGPLLFVLYTSDLSSCQPILYADDTCLFASGVSFDEVTVQMQKDLDVLSSWFRDNLLQLNTTKSELVLFKKSWKDKQNPFDFSVAIKGCHLKPTSHVKYLGIVVDENLNWKHQTDSVVTKAPRTLGILDNMDRT